jgi:hypothetical protein
MDLIIKTPEQKQKDMEKTHDEFVKSWGMTPEQAKQYAETGINPMTGFDRGVTISVKQKKPTQLKTTQNI